MSEATQNRAFSVFDEAGEIEAVPAEIDHFALLGFERRFGVDAEALESAFYRLSRRLHPDFFMDAPAAVRVRSLEATARVNAAYQTLREPAARAAYLVELESGALAENDAKPPAELLEEIFEAREAVEALRPRGDAEDGERLRERIGAARECFLALRRGQRTALDGLGAAWDEAAERGEPAPPEILRKMRAVLGSRKYIENTLKSLNDALEKSG